MSAPPTNADPYDYVPADAPNRGSQGVMVAWDAMRQYYGTELPNHVNFLQFIITDYGIPNP